MTAPSKKLDQFVVRLPDGMRERIKEAAARNGRSMNAEIVSTLDERYPEPFTTADLPIASAEAAAMLAELEASMRRWLRERDRSFFYKSDFRNTDED